MFLDKTPKTVLARAFLFCCQIFILLQLFCFAAAFFFRRGFFNLPWLFCFAAAFLFCRGFFNLLWLFCFAAAFSFCRGFSSFAVAFLVGCDIFILPWHFCFAVAFLFCCSFLVLPWHLWATVEMTPTDLRFQTGVKTSSAHVKFRFGWISKRPNILMDICRHFISGSVYMIFYHPKWNFISIKMADMKSIPALSQTLMQLFRKSIEMFSVK